MADHKVTIKIALQNLTQRGLSAVTKGLSALRSHAASVGRSLGNAFLHPINTIWKLKAALIPVTAAVVAFGATIKAAFNRETLDAQFTTMLGSAQKARDMIKQLRDASEASPFTETQYIEAAKALLAFGVAARDVSDTLKVLGDIAAGSGADFKDLAFVYGQVKGSGKAMMQDMYQFVNAGIPIFDALATATKRGVSEIKDAISKGLISFSDVDRALRSLTTETGVYHDAMKSLATTGNGLISTLKGKWIGAVADFGEAFKNLAKHGLLKAIELIDKLRNDGTIEKFANEAKNALESVIQIAKALTDAEKRPEILAALGDLIISSFQIAAITAGDYLLAVAPKIGRAIADAARDFRPRGDRHDAISELEGQGKISQFEAMNARVPGLNIANEGFGKVGAKLGSDFAKQQMERTQEIERMIAEEISRALNAPINVAASPALQTAMAQQHNAIARLKTLAAPPKARPFLNAFNGSDRPQFDVAPLPNPFQGQQRPVAGRHMNLYDSMKNVMQSDDPQWKEVQERWKKRMFDSLTPQQQLKSLEKDYNALKAQPRTPENVDKMLDIQDQAKEIKQGIKEAAAERERKNEQNLEERGSLTKQAAEMAKPTRSEIGISEYFNWMRSVKSGKSPDEMIADNTAKMAEILRSIDKNISAGGLI